MTNWTAVMDQPVGFGDDGKRLSTEEFEKRKENVPALIDAAEARANPNHDKLGIDPIGLKIMGGFAQQRDEESRSLKLSTITREVHRGTDSCILCRTNTDPSKIPVHPNCTCNASTQDIEVGQVPGDDSHFRIMSTANEDVVFLSESDLPAAIIMDPATTGVVEITDLRFGDLARWLEKMQPYLEGANQVLTILSEVEQSNEDVSTAADVADVAAEESESALQAITSRRVWFGIASEVAGL